MSKTALKIQFESNSQHSGIHTIEGGACQRPH